MASDLGAWVKENSALLDQRPYRWCSATSGNLLLLVSGLLQAGLVGGWILAYLAASGSTQPWLRNLYLPIGGAIFAIHIAMVRQYRRFLAKDELHALLASAPHPAVYLRGFDTDVEKLYRGHSIESRSERGLSYDFRSWTVEDEAVKALASICPAIAIGRPGDALPPAGASRLYCSERASWQRVALALFDCANLIVLRHSISKGVQWELEQALSERHRCKVAILLVDAEGQPFSKRAYLEFRAQIESKCGLGLPLAGWNSWFMYFDSTGTARFIDADSTGDPEELRSATRALVGAHPNGPMLRYAARGKITSNTLCFLLLRWLWPVVVLVSIIAVGFGAIAESKREDYHYHYIDPLRGFAIAGADRKFVLAEAAANRDGIITVSSDKVPNPLAGRYAWADNPANNVYDNTRLPLTPFRTDDWPGTTDGVLVH
jgi:hypothetical protein